MSKEFGGLYSEVGRPSIPPEGLLRALLRQVFYSICSERLLMEQLDYNLRWFVGLEIHDRVWDPTVYIQEPGPVVEPGSGATVVPPSEGAGRPD
jgi:transposase